MFCYARAIDELELAGWLVRVAAIGWMSKTDAWQSSTYVCVLSCADIDRSSSSTTCVNVGEVTVNDGGIG